MRRTLEAAWDSIGDVRPGTIGEWVKGRIGTLESMTRVPLKPKPKEKESTDKPTGSKRRRSESQESSGQCAPMDTDFTD